MIFEQIDDKTEYRKVGDNVQVWRRTSDDINLTKLNQKKATLQSIIKMNNDVIGKILALNNSREPTLGVKEAAKIEIEMINDQIEKVTSALEEGG